MHGCTHLSRFALVSRVFSGINAKKYTGYCIIACVPMCLVVPEKMSRSFLKELCLSKASVLNGFGRFVLLCLIHLLDLQYGTEKDAMFIEANVIKNL